MKLLIFAGESCCWAKKELLSPTIDAKLMRFKIGYWFCTVFNIRWKSAANADPNIPSKKPKDCSGVKSIEYVFENFLPKDHDEFNSLHYFFYNLGTLDELLRQAGMVITESKRIHYTKRNLIRLIVVAEREGP